MYNQVLLSIMAGNALVLKHQAITSQNADSTHYILDQFRNEKWPLWKWIHLEAENPLWKKNDPVITA